MLETLEKDIQRVEKKLNHVISFSPKGDVFYIQIPPKEVDLLLREYYFVQYSKANNTKEDNFELAKELKYYKFCNAFIQDSFYEAFESTMFMKISKKIHDIELKYNLVMNLEPKHILEDCKYCNNKKIVEMQQDIISTINSIAFDWQSEKYQRIFKKYDNLFYDLSNLLNDAHKLNHKFLLKLYCGISIDHLKEEPPHHLLEQLNTIIIYYNSLNNEFTDEILPDFCLHCYGRDVVYDNSSNFKLSYIDPIIEISDNFRSALTDIITLYNNIDIYILEYLDIYKKFI